MQPQDETNSRRYDDDEVVIPDDAPPWVKDYVLLVAPVHLVETALEKDDVLAGAFGDDKRLDRARHLQAVLKDTFSGIRRFFQQVDSGAVRMPHRTYSSLVEAYNNIARLQDDLRSRVAPFFDSGNPIAAIFVLADSRLPQDAKLLAAQQLAEKSFYKPIARQRWTALAGGLVKELNQRADEQGRAPEAVLRESTIQSLFLAMATAWEPIESLSFVDNGKHYRLTSFFGRNEPAFFEWSLYWPWLRQRVSDSVCEDLLGPSWRDSHTNFGEAPAVTVTAEDAQEMLENRLELEDVRTLCAPTEAKLLDFLLEGFSLAEAAHALGWAESTARVTMSRIRKKAGRMSRM